MGWNNKDSRLRTIQRECGKVFLIWHGVKFQQGHDSRLAPGDAVEVGTGSSITDPITVNCPAKGLSDGTGRWHFMGIVGGEKNRAKVEADWARSVTPSIKGPLGPPQLSTNLPAGPERVLEPRLGPKSPREPKIRARMAVDEVRDLANQYDFILVAPTVTVQFVSRDKATGFRVAALQRGWTVSEVTELFRNCFEVKVCEK